MNGNNCDAREFPEGGLRQHAIERVRCAAIILPVFACTVAASYAVHAASRTTHLVLTVAAWALAALFVGGVAVLVVRLWAPLIANLRSSH